jgi:hypothetical protein
MELNKEFVIITIIALILAGLSCYTIFQYKSESYSNVREIPVTLHFDDVILIDEDKDYTDYYVQEKLGENFDMEVNINKEDVTLQLCRDNDCKFKLTHDVDMKKYLGPSIINNQIETGAYLRIRPKKIEEFESEQLRTSYKTLGIKMKLNSTIPLNKTVSVKDIYNNAIKQKNIDVYFTKSDDVIKNYDIYVCKWNDENKSAICQVIDWELRSDIPDIFIGSSRSFNMFRIKKKNIINN